MDSFSNYVFVRAGKHTSVHYLHPHSNGVTVRRIDGAWLSCVMRSNNYKSSCNTSNRYTTASSIFLTVTLPLLHCDVGVHHCLYQGMSLEATKGLFRM